MKSKKIITAVLVGGFAIGTIAGFLFASDKGSATREKIKEASEDFATSFKEKFNELVDEIKEKYESNKKGSTT